MKVLEFTDKDLVVMKTSKYLYTHPKYPIYLYNRGKITLEEYFEMKKKQNKPTGTTYQ